MKRIMNPGKPAAVVGDVFLLPLNDGTWTAGQILDSPIRDLVSCSFYDERIGDSASVPHLQDDALVALLTVTRVALDDGRWIVVNHEPPRVERARWPNERYRANRWVGAKIYDAKIAENLLNSYFGLSYWDQYYDPNYFDKLLLDPARKPHPIKLKSHA